MIPLLTREAVRALDADAIERLGVPGIVLMENAGRGATEAIVARFGDRLGRVVVVAGPGQNGGDGWVVCRHLRDLGHAPVGVLVGDEDRVRGDARVNLDAARALDLDVRVLPLGEVGALRAALEGATLAVDALFGTGLDRPITGGWADAVRSLDAAACPCVALDLPSGVDADTGAILGVAPTAAATITFAAHKRGLHQFPAAARVGEVVRVSIGVPGPSGSTVALIEERDVAHVVASRDADEHKGSAGHVLVIGGAPGRTGAAALAGLGALRGGAGLVTIASAASAALDAKVVELMTAPLPTGATHALATAITLAEGKRGAVVGPGLGLDADAAAVALALARDLPAPAVLDADALTALAAEGIEGIADVAEVRVLTPHPGEAGRLLGASTAEVQADRYGAASALASRSGHVIVLKGARSIVAAPDGRMRVCPFGTPALGVAGTGDVLAGAIAASLRGGDVLEEVAAAVALHAIAGELAAVGDRGLLASEVAHALPRALLRCRGG